MQTIKAQVSSRILAKADRFFAGGVREITREQVQNARRAGAKCVDIYIRNFDDGRPALIEFRDNGSGIKDFQDLLTLGDSGWSESIEAIEDPAGFGFYVLRGRHVTIDSCGKRAVIRSGDWDGNEIVVEPGAVTFGTLISFHALPHEQWNRDAVAECLKYCPIEVTIDGDVLERTPFFDPAHPVVDLSDLGVRIQVSNRSLAVYPEQSAFNFHGHVTFTHAIDLPERTFARIEFINAKTPLKLVLPGRTEFVKNAAFEQLTTHLRREAYSYFMRCGSHYLPYENWLEARQMGVDLPEATPTFDHVTSDSDDLLDFRGSASDLEHIDKFFAVDDTTIVRFDGEIVPESKYDACSDIIESVGTVEWVLDGASPLCLRDVPGCMVGYSWAKLPVLKEISIKAEEKLHATDLWGHDLHIVSAINVAVTTAAGAVLTFSLPAVKSPPAKDCDWPSVTMTRACLQENGTRFIAWFVGGFSTDNEADSWETQEHDLSVRVDEILLEIVPPHLRIVPAITEFVRTIKREMPSAAFVTIGLSAKRISVQSEDGRVDEYKFDSADDSYPFSFEWIDPHNVKIPG